MGTCAKTGTDSGFEMAYGYEENYDIGKNFDYKKDDGTIVDPTNGVNDLYNKWTKTCPFSLKDEGSISKDDTVDDLIEYSGTGQNAEDNKIASKRAYDDLMNEIYRRILVMKSFGVDSSMEERDSSLIDTLNEKIKQQQRYTFSLLSKVLIFAFFVILVIATIITNSKILYFITFSIMALMVILNMTVMQNNI